MREHMRKVGRRDPSLNYSLSKAHQNVSHAKCGLSVKDLDEPTLRRLCALYAIDYVCLEHLYPRAQSPCGPEQDALQSWLRESDVSRSTLPAPGSKRPPSR